jgi:uncharacterized protein (DUF1501 family)
VPTSLYGTAPVVASRSLGDLRLNGGQNRGVETVTIDYGNWDHHVNVVGGVELMATDLAKALAAFFTDLGAHGNRVTLVTISEFGRRVHENGARGLDHGWGNVMLLLGAGVNGGKVHGEWPGLGVLELREGDLQVTRDYRTTSPKSCGPGSRTWTRPGCSPLPRGQRARRGHVIAAPCPGTLTRSLCPSSSGDRASAS